MNKSRKKNLFIPQEELTTLMLDGPSPQVFTAAEVHNAELMREASLVGVVFTEFAPVGSVKLEVTSQVKLMPK